MDKETSITLDFTADELMGIAQAMKVRGLTFSEFIDFALRTAIETSKEEA